MNNKNPNVDERVKDQKDRIALVGRLTIWMKDIRSDRPPSSIWRTTDPQLRERAGLIYRMLGFIVCAIVIYLIAFNVFDNTLSQAWQWVFFYLSYLLFLEVVRVKWKEQFHKSIFRALRIIINIVAITWLISLSPQATSATSLFFVIPIFAAIVYFPNSKRWVAGTYILSIVGIILGGLFLYRDIPMSLTQIFFTIIALSALGFAFYWLDQNVFVGSDLINSVAIPLHQTLELQDLLTKIAELAKKFTQAQRVLVIIVDSKTKDYIGHNSIGFGLKEGFSIEDVARKCSVLTTGHPFNCPDMEAYYNNKDIYSIFFTCKPQSVSAAPLFNREGTVIGVISVAHDQPDQFDNTAKDILLGFSYLVSSAVENSLIHRQVKIREIRSRSVTRIFARARNEREIFSLLLQETKIIFPNASSCILHRFDGNAGGEQNTEKDGVLVPWIWESDDYDTPPAKFNYDYGLAGKALKIREPIIANDVSQHPWFVKLDTEEEIKSMLVCPLFDPNTEVDYGTLSINSNKLGTFSPEDELAALSLTNQASLVIAKIREFEEWQRQGGILRRILNEVRYFNLGTSDEVLCCQITDLAIKLLEFKMARIRLLTVGGNELVTVALSGLPEKDSKNLIGHRMPYSALEPFFNDEYQEGRSYIIPHGNSLWKNVVDKYFYIPHNQHNKHTGWKAYNAILTPLIGPSGQMLGILTMDLPKDGSYPTSYSIEQIDLFANIAAWVIELSRYQSRLTDQQNRTKSFIDTISEELARGHDFQTLGEVVVQVGSKLISAEGCNLFMVREKEIELSHSSYLADTDYIGRRKPISTEPKHGLTSLVAAMGESLMSNNEEYKSHPNWGGQKSHLKYLSSKKCESLLLVPIKNKNKNIIGVLALENKKNRYGLIDFDDQDRFRLTTLACEVGEALERIGRYEAIKKWERKGLEDDLHFLINWYRFGVLAPIEQLKDAVDRNAFDHAKQILPELLLNARNSVNELKALHTMIINDCLEAKNLQEGLLRLIDAWRKRVIPKYDKDIPMKIILDCPENIDLETPLRNTIIRIASEALSNAIFHSGIIDNPKIRIKIESKYQNKKYVLKITDNGVGKGTFQEGVGIDRMKQLKKQVNSWGGIRANLNIKSKPGKGTQVIFDAKYLNS